jgi:hypothetical protein
MRSAVVKNTNGLLMLFIHFGAIYFVFQRVSARLKPEDQLAVVMILAPLTATFVTLFLKDAVRNARGQVEASVDIRSVSQPLLC